MRKLGCFVKENILHNQALQRRQRCFNMLSVGVRLGNIFTLAIHALEGAINSGIKHIRNTQSRFRINAHTPGILKQLARCIIRDVTIPR